MENFDNNEQEKIILNKSDIQSNINYFIKVADIGGVLFYGLAALIFLYGLITMEDSDIHFLIYLIVALFLAFNGLLFELNLKWKAYMLQINYGKLKAK